MSADVPPRTTTPRATDRPGDASPFALGLLLRRAHWRAATLISQALKPLGIELRHFAVLIVLVNEGPTVQRDLAAATGTDKAGIMRVVDDLDGSPPGLVGYQVEDGSTADLAQLPRRHD